MNELRNNGIYTLPNGSAYALFSAGRGRYFLYPCDGGAFNPPSFEATRDGRVLPWLGGGDKWCVTDLEDTGLTYSFPEGFNCPE